jgi:hypothetical protein
MTKRTHDTATHFYFTGLTAGVYTVGWLALAAIIYATGR